MPRVTRRDHAVARFDKLRSRRESLSPYCRGYLDATERILSWLSADRLECFCAAIEAAERQGGEP